MGHRRACKSESPLGSQATSRSRERPSCHLESLAVDVVACYVERKEYGCLEERPGSKLSRGGSSTVGMVVDE